MAEEKIKQQNSNGKLIGGITGKGFMPGQSGNLNGRPKDTLKAFVARQFREMTDEQKRLWLKQNKLSPEVMWKMAEGNPKNDMGIDPESNIIRVISIDE